MLGVGLNDLNCLFFSYLLLSSLLFSSLLFQALALRAFNDADALTVRELRRITGIADDGELKRTLLSLAVNPRVRVLTLRRAASASASGAGASGAGAAGGASASASASAAGGGAARAAPPELADDDTLALNVAFAHPKFRLKIPTIQAKEVAEQEHDKVEEALFRDRQYQVDAAVVRIMKARKSLSHNLLLSELLAQLKFPAAPADIKQRIESLIERDYLERDEATPSVYNYLA